MAILELREHTNDHSGIKGAHLNDHSGIKGVK